MTTKIYNKNPRQKLDLNLLRRSFDRKIWTASTDALYRASSLPTLTPSSDRLSQHAMAIRSVYRDPSANAVKLRHYPLNSELTVQ